MPNTCKTKYPILLVHGTGSRDSSNKTCWGRIPEALTSQGATVYFGCQDAWGTIEENAQMVKKTIGKILSDHEKINIIALSKGGLEARYLISKLDMAEKIASLTTVSTPHQGSKTMDFLDTYFKYVLKLLAVFMNFQARLRGDKKPDFYEMLRQLTTTSCRRFNEEILNSPKVYYQSYASIMKKPYSDMLLFVPHLLVKHLDGECDGIVSIGSSKWGEFKGIITGEGIRGVSHSDLRDLRKKDGAGTDIRGVYVNIVKDLKAKNF